MKIGFRHIGLIIGILAVIFSFLFFGRQHETYHFLLLGGLLVSAISFLSIVLSKDTKKAKFTWSSVVIFAIVVQFLTEPILIDTSYGIYIEQNTEELSQINHILLQKPGSISVFRDSIIDQENLLTIEEKAKLANAIQKTNLYWIYKSDNEVYFGLWGFLDVRLGVTYWADNEAPNETYRHLSGNWYYQ
jgi:hypothetical protein